MPGPRQGYSKSREVGSEVTLGLQDAVVGLFSTYGDQAYEWSELLPDEDKAIADAMDILKAIGDCMELRILLTW